MRSAKEKRVAEVVAAKRQFPSEAGAAPEPGKCYAFVGVAASEECCPVACDVSGRRTRYLPVGSVVLALRVARDPRAPVNALWSVLCDGKVVYVSSLWFASTAAKARASLEARFVDVERL